MKQYGILGGTPIFFQIEMGQGGVSVPTTMTSGQDMQMYDPQAMLASIFGTSSGYTPVKVRLRRRDRGRGESAMPGYLADDYSTSQNDPGNVPGDLLNELFKMSARDVDQLKRRMFLAGYYGLEALADGQVPQMGVVRAEDVEAWGALINDAAMYSAANPDTDMSVEEMLEARMQGAAEVAQTGGLPGTGGYASVEYLPPEIVTLTDQAAIRQTATRQAVDVLGRELSPDEMNAIGSIVSSQEYAQEVANAQKRQGIKRASIAQQDSIRQQMRNNAMSTLPPEDTSLMEPVILDGEGPGSRTYQYGHGIANKMGVQVMGETTKQGPDDWKGGRTMYFSGDSARLEAMASWLEQNGLVENLDGIQVVGVDPNTGAPLQGTDAEGNPVTGSGAKVLAVTFAAGAEAPGLGPLNGRPKNELDAFLGAIRRDGGSEAYTWEGSGVGDPGTLRGAYGISDTMWLHYADRLGIDPNDHTTKSQDLVARTYAADLYAKYNDWGLAGLAFRYGEGMANAYRDNRAAGKLWENPKFDLDGDIQKIGTKMAEYSTSDSRDTIAALEQQGFAFGGGRGGTLVMGGGVETLPGFDPEARAREELEKRNAPEAQAYGTLQAFDVFSSIMGGSTSLARGES